MYPKRVSRPAEWTESYSFNLAAFFLLMVLTLFSSPSDARAYRCTDAKGNVSYMQSPCSAGQTGARVRGVGTNVKVAHEACAPVRTFATTSFNKLKRGTDPSAQIDQYGGPGYINKITLNVINFVSGFRMNQELHAMKVSGMAYSKCINGGFGKIQISDLPPEMLAPDLPEPDDPSISSTGVDLK
ncbi:hypothetical protein MNBD_GAMMA15-449 [hydrothermal vent metagenome]|uniref:DUF4124 domain-containing protein n=1 Tax=hydrothermal vent metagenome TaxID=652676 RepID=A0A3B0Z5J1_9ZZZZ